MGEEEEGRKKEDIIFFLACALRILQNIFHFY